MGIFDPRLDVNLLLWDRRELISRAEDQLGRRLQFKARTLKILEINGERILDGQVVVHDERVRGRNSWEGRDIPGAISYLEAYDGEPALYEVQLWLEGPAFEDLRTCDLGTSTVELYADATGSPEAIKDRIFENQWDAKISRELVLERTTIWIKPNPSQKAAPEKTQPEMPSFERQVMETLRSLGQTATWILALVGGIFITILASARGCR